MLPAFQTDDDSNFTDPPTRAKVFMATILPLYALTLVIVGARFLVKTKLNKLGVDDLLIGISMTLALAVLGCTLMTIKYGFGMHTADIRPEWWLPYGKMFFAAIALSSPCVFITKTSMICFYLTLAPHAGFRTACYASVALTTLLWSSIFLINVFGCVPLSGAWDRSSRGTPARCITTAWFYRFSTLCNLATDGLVMLLPVPVLMRMQLSVKTKIGLLVMFSMGFSTTVISGLCLHALNVMINSTDEAWDGCYTWLWALLEVSAGIMTACMPSMTLFWRWATGEYRDGRNVVGVGAARGKGSTIGGGARRGAKAPPLGSVGSGSVVLNDVGLVGEC